MYNFDKIVDRHGTYATKWDPKAIRDTFSVDDKDILPLWIADMDFEVAPAIKEAAEKVASHGVYGYTRNTEANDELANWLEKRHNWKIEQDWIVNTPGVVFAINMAIHAFSRPGDNILIQRPVYYPFTNSIENNGRKVLSSSFIDNGGVFEIDFESFEQHAKDPQTTMLILCSPHNPLSKVFTKEELKKMLDIAFENKLTVVADEIHNDLIMPGVEFTSVGNLGSDYYNKVITCVAPSKTFNIAGAQWSGIIIPDADMRAKFERTMAQAGVDISNPFSQAVVAAAYRDGAEWLDEAIEYIYSNFIYMRDKFKDAFSDKVKVVELQATYLAFVSFSGLGYTPEEIDDIILNDAKVALDSGHWFGPEGDGYMRFNLACPRSIIEEATDRIIKAFQAK